MPRLEASQEDLSGGSFAADEEEALRQEVATAKDGADQAENDGKVSHFQKFSKYVSTQQRIKVSHLLSLSC
jgi:hypothetical protein